MWARMGFGALCLAILLDAAWIVSLVREEPAPAPSGLSAPTAPEPSATTPAKLEPSPSLDQAAAGSVPPGVPDDAVEVEVLKHTDGDTLHVTPVVAGGSLIAGTDTTVRLLEIDTPESVDPSSPVQCFARQASRHLKGLLPLGSRAWATEDVEPLDPYGRTLLYLWNDDGSFVNLEMVEAGMARAVLYEPNDAYIAEMRAAQRQARSAGRGLWRACEQAGPRGVLGTSESSAGQSALTDPRFAYCYEANDAGLGNYRRGVDAEYEWYDDVDGDGVVCEF